MITIIDYGAGNLLSVEKALNYLGFKTNVTDNPLEIEKAEKIILPGVGCFGSAMDKLQSKGLDILLKSLLTETQVPFLGICLGMQLLFDYSEESDCEGLGILPGRIIKIPDTGLKIPQIGWNSLNIKRGKLLGQIPDKSYVYFVHSYFLEPEDEGVVSATVDYGVPLSIAVEKGNVFAVQFHPEKSGTVGLNILKTFGGISK